jgi:membrane glycosyltransferase
MNKHFPKTAKDIKGPVAIAELRRAHLIIAVLASAFAATIGFMPIMQLQFDTVLGLILVVLLAIVAVVSLCTALVLHKR